MNDKRLLSGDGKIFTVMSIIQGNGAKYFATNLAYYMKNSNKKNQPKVLLIDFDFDAPYLAHEYVKNDMVHGIDNIINTINSDSLTPELFFDNMVKTSFGVDIIKGTQFPENKRVFTRKTIETIISFSKELYDYTVIVIGNKSNDAGMVYSLMNTDEVILVGKNDFSNMLKAPKILETVRSFYKNFSKIMLVHNYKNFNAKADLNSVFADSNVKVVGVLSYDEKSVDNLNLSRKKGMFGNSLNEKEFTNIVNYILGKDIKSSTGKNKKNEQKED